VLVFVWGFRTQGIRHRRMALGMCEGANGSAG
jgi:hypothetical protein